MSKTVTYVRQLRRYLEELDAMTNYLYAEESIEAELRSNICWELIRLKGSIIDAMASIAAMETEAQKP